jgi:hypothetical protein
MKTTLLATVAVAALAFGGTMAGAQDRGGSDVKTSPAQSSGGMSSGGAMGGAEKSTPDKPASRAAQSEPNRGAAEADHATGQRRAAEQRSTSGPNHDTGQARAEDRRSDMNRSSAADSDKSDKAKNQAQQDRSEPNRTGANEPSRDNSKGQAQNERSDKGKSPSTAAGERDRKADQAQKATDSKEQMKSGAATSAPNKNTASAPQGKSDTRSDRMGANERNSSNSAQNSSSSEDVNVTGSIQVDRQKASRVHDELIRNAPRTNIDISVSVGATLPSRVRARPVPASIISISPEFRGYDYVVVHDEIVIVEPKTKKVVTIIQSNGGHQRKAQRASFSLNPSQKSRIRSDIKMDDARSFDVEVREGRVVPQTVVLQPLPDVVYSEVPEARDYRYFVDDRRIVIVDPETREVVDIID